MNRQHFTPPFSPSSPPAWCCPACGGAALAVVKDSFRVEETADSKENRNHSDWEPFWFKQQFSILLRCHKCEEPVFSLGHTESVESDDEEHGRVFSDAIVPQFFVPAVPMIGLPKGCPKEIADEVINASSLYWSSPASAGNRIRVCVERLMDYVKIPKKGKTKKGEFQDLTLHARIERYTKKSPDVGQKLLAIKWLGNAGSHSEDLKQTDVLDAFELLSYALEEILEGKSNRLKQLTSSIIKSKGPVSK
jgi:Domain of unknown function (DUF4145)